MRGEAYFKFLLVYHAETLSHLQMLTNNQKERILALSSAADKELRKGSVLYGERKERKEKDRVVGNLKGNRKVGKRQDRRLRRMDARASSCTVLMVKWGSCTSGLHRSCFLINEHKITTTHVEFSKEDVDIAQACVSLVAEQEFRAQTWRVGRAWLFISFSG